MDYNIEIMSKWRCELFSEKILDKKYIIISINDTNSDTDIAENKDIAHILKVWFDDISIASEEETGLKMMSVANAKDIVNFIEKYKDEIKNIVIHCTAGISRSGAVGCTLARYLNGDDTYLLETGEYVPNKHVYKLMCEVLNLKYSEQLFKGKTRLINKGNRDNLKGYGSYGVNIDDMFCDVIIEENDKNS